MVPAMAPVDDVCPNRGKHPSRTTTEKTNSHEKKRLCICGLFSARNAYWIGVRIWKIVLHFIAGCNEINIIWFAYRVDNA